MRRPRSLPALAFCLLAGAGASSGPLAADQPAGLRAPDSFQAIADPAARSAALFEEAARVLEHPRCMNCHPADRRPTQGDDLHPHEPPMFAGEGMGRPGLACHACHGAENRVTLDANLPSIPGAEPWLLAPAEMAWQGLSTGEICAQIKDPARNGGRDLAAIHHHLAEDHLVAWAWHPGEGRTPAPGTQAAFGALIEAWIATGAACPDG